jgi:sporulation protein YlmC with PRC-barrel domain
VAIAYLFRTADIVGMPIRNTKGENLGKIDDLVIDMKEGDVRYAALSFGGIAGFGGKLFAVPWQAMTFKFGEPNNINSRYFLFDVTKEKLERAPGFNSSHWPDVADPQWSASIDKHYEVDRKQTSSSRGEDKTRSTVDYETVFRSGKIKGMEVRTDLGEDLARVDELVIDVLKGQVRYVVLASGSLLSGGTRLFSVPLSSITLTHASDKTFLVLSVSKESLKGAPSFEKNDWPRTSDPNWSRNIDTYYERNARKTETNRP